MIWYKPSGASGVNKPIKVNITLWVVYDIIPWLDKMNKDNRRMKANQPERKIKEMCDKEFGDRGEFLGLFDSIIDAS